MAKRIYVNSNNYLIIANNADLSDDVRNSASNIYTEVNGTLFLFYRKTPSALLESIYFADILDVDGNAYSSLEKFRDIVESASASIPVSEEQKDPMLEIAAGRIPDKSTVHKFGSNQDVATGVREDVNDMGGVYAYPTVTADMTHLSQAADQAALRGMHIEIDGNDIDNDRVIQLALMDAIDTSTPIVLTTPLFRVNTMQVQANLKADSNIRLHNLADTITYSQITSDNNQTLQTNYSVPRGHTAYMTNVYGDVIESTGKEPKSVEFKLWVANRKEDWDFQLKSARGVPKAGPAATHRFEPYLRITEMSDIKITAQPSDQPAHVHGGFDLIVEKD